MVIWLANDDDNEFAAGKFQIMQSKQLTSPSREDSPTLHHQTFEKFSFFFLNKFGS
jgi:hypothetical protein